MNDIERALHMRENKAAVGAYDEAQRIASAYVERLSPEMQPLEVAREVLAFLIGAIAVSDAFGLDRKQAVRVLSALVAGIPFPSAVVE